VAESVSTGGPNDLLERLAADPAFAAQARVSDFELDPAGYTGRAATQVEEFLIEYFHPHRARVQALAGDAEAAEVTV